MSKAVEGVTEKIEEYARKEFKSKGYVDASLRTIAMEAGTTTGSIYSHHKTHLLIYFIINHHALPYLFCHTRYRIPHLIQFRK